MPESTEKTPEQEAEERDRKLLAENAARIEGIVKLLLENENRETADRKVDEARMRIQAEEADGSGGAVANESGSVNTSDAKDGRGRKSSTVFHPYNGKRVPITTKASRYLELGDALELQLRTREHGRDLLRALHGAAATRVRILERILERGM
jgi:hypothetical protein